MISQHAMQSIGWALIHSLWQGLALYFILKISLRFWNRSDIRYGFGVVTLLLLVGSFVATFLILNRETASQGFAFTIDVTAATTNESASFIQRTLQFIDQNIIWLFRFWLLGLAAGLLRIAAGLWYINRLRRNASPARDE